MAKESSVYKHWLAAFQALLKEQGHGAQIKIARQVGVTPKYINDIVLEKQGASLPLQERIATALGLTYEDMLARGHSGQTSSRANMAKEQQSQQPMLALQKTSMPERLKVLLGDLSIRKFAIKCDLPDSTMRGYIEGKRSPTIQNCLKIAKICKVPAGWLLAGETGSPKDLISEIDSSSSQEAFFPETVALADSIDNWFRSLPQLKRSEMTVLIAGFLKENGLPEDQ